MNPLGPLTKQEFVLQIAFKEELTSILVLTIFRDNRWRTGQKLTELRSGRDFTEKFGT